MTWSAFAARWFGLGPSSATPASRPERLVLEHYEEDDEYGADAGADEGSDAKSASDDHAGESDGYFRPSSLFAVIYEEEAAHLQEAAERLLDLDEPLLEA